MILVNIKTNRLIKITYNEFKKQFSQDIKQAYKVYLLKGNKIYFKNRTIIPSVFYSNLPWNFNKYSNSIWQIKKL